ncbi:MAG: hypothetical protein K1V84_11940 [Muribaculaceae bacterium]
MSAEKIYTTVAAYLPDIATTNVCDLHSACSPVKHKTYMCEGKKGSRYPMIDFDRIKERYCKANSLKSIKSIDALALSPSKSRLCLIELKSWLMVLEPPVESKRSPATPTDVEAQTTKYSSALPTKLASSITLCREITDDPTLFTDLAIDYILVTDIDTDTDAIEGLLSNLSALAGTGSKLIPLCNRLSRDIMSGITNADTHYWHCRDLDTKIQSL